MNDFSRSNLSLSPQKRALLDALLKQQGVHAEPRHRIQPRSGDGPVPLSFAQERLWVLDQLEPGSSVYNVPGAFPLPGPLHVGALERSINEIVRRHEILRTTFAMVNNRPAQIVSPSLTIPLPVLDLSPLSEAERKAEFEQRLAEEVQHAFDLAKGPLLRAMLIRRAPQDHVLLLNMHHIVSDAWSMTVFFRELAALYEAFGRGRPSPLPELSLQYADFAVWQRQTLQGEVLAKHLAYWKARLAGAPAVLELPTDRPRGPLQSSRGAIHYFHLPESLSQALRTLSKQEGATLFMTLLAAFDVLLHRYTGRTDIVVGSPIANRNRTEIEELIGFFLNTLVLRSDCSGNPSFRDLLRRVREVTMGAFAHQDLPFEKLVEELQPERDLSRNPLFQVMFTLQTERGAGAAGASREVLQVVTGTAKFDLTLSIFDGEGPLAGALEYSTDLFDAATIERMSRHLQTLLEGVVADPDQRLSALPLLPEAERQQLLVVWNDTRVDYPENACIHHLFEAQAARTPGAVAVMFEAESISYGDLNRRANQLANDLVKSGVRPEVRVGVCLERSVEYVIGLLGILKAGGVYLPLDPAYPAQRLHFILKDADVPITLTKTQFMDRFAGYAGSLLCWDAEGERIAREASTPPAVAVAADNLAYVIYTSGSTGIPKGVVLSHRPLVNLVTWQIAVSPWGAGARTLQFSSLTFDVSLQEMFATWGAGGTLVIPTDETRLDVRKLLRLLREAGVERLFLPYVALQQLAEAAVQDNELPYALREVITAGEQLKATPAIKDFFSRLPDCVLHNQYGPSESHIVSELPLTGAPQQWPELPPIGRPVANTRFYVLDRHLQPVPLGVPGELYIGGACLARGYLGRPALTAEKFIPDPFSKKPGERLYKTGDGVRYRADGNIDFLGRIDGQLKIRGFRIEPGEIEAVLARHPAVAEAVVVGRSDEHGVKRLVAYVVTTPGQMISVGELGRFLRQVLPEYMVPSAFVFLDVLPLTASGKVDRLALPEPDSQRPVMENVFVAPRNPTEASLAQIWAEFLGLDKVGVHDNFFELGGHSLLATQVASRVRDVFGVEVPLRVFFEKPTIEDGAAAIFQARVEQGDAQEMARLLAEIEQLSDVEAHRLLSSGA